MKYPTAFGENPDSEGYLQQIARIFATGILRLHKRGVLAAGPDRQEAENLPESGRQGLELSGDRRLSVRAG